MRDWTAMATFDGIDLSESFVLSWGLDNCDLLFEFDFVLAKDHPSYQPPRVDEWACFRRGTLRFTNTRAITGLPPMAEVRPAIDGNGDVDYGHFDSFVEEAAGRFKIEGDFGAIVIESEPPNVAVHVNGL